MSTCLGRRSRRVRSSIRVLQTAALATPAALAVLAMLPAAARAANAHWDLNGTTAGATDDPGGVASGIWDSVTPNWNATADGTGTAGTIPFAPGDTPIFSAGTNATGASTITVVGPQDVTNMTFQEGTLTFQGDQITLLGPTLNTTATTTINNVIGGTVGLTKSGVGSLTLTGSNVLTGNTAVNAGTLNLDYSINNDNKIDSGGTLTLGNGAALNLIGSSSGATSQSVASTTLNANTRSNVTVTGNGGQSATLNLGAITRNAASVTNFDTVGAATVNTANTATNGTIGLWTTLNKSDWANVDGSGNVIAATYAANDFSADNNVDVTSDQTPAADVSVNSLRFNTAAPVSVNLSGANTFAGVLVTPAVGANAVNVSGGTITTTGEFIVQQHNTDGELNLHSSLTGSGVALTKGGAGTLIIHGDNNNTGAYNVVAGTMRLAGSERLNNSSTVQVVAGATFDLNGQTERIGALTGGGVTTMNGGSLTVGQSSNATYSGTFTGGGLITKLGTNVQTMSGTGSTYSGKWVIQQGTIAIPSDSGSAGAAAPLGAVPASATSDFITLDGGNLRNTSSSTTASFMVTNRGTTVTANGGAFEVSNAAGSLGYAGIINNSSGGRWTKAGAGTLRLTGNMVGSSSSSVAVTAGTLQIDAATRFGTQERIVLNGGTLRNTASGNAGAFISSSAILEIGPNGGTVDYASSGTGTVSIYTPTASTGIMGTGTLTKTGALEFRVQGPGLANSTYTKLVVNQGIFRLGFNQEIQDERGFGAVPAAFMQDQITLNGGSIGTSFTAANSVLHANRGITLGPNGGSTITNLTVPGKITGVGGLTHTAQVLVLGGANDFNGNLTANARVDVTENQNIGGIAGTATINISADKTLTAGKNNEDTTFNGILASAGGYTKVGTGTITLMGNEFTNAGPTQINGGTLKFGASSAGLANSSAVSIGAAGTLDAGGVNDTIGSLAGSGPIINGANLTVAGNNGAPVTYSGNYSGTGSFTKNGAGTQNLGGTNTFSAVNVNAGVLGVQSSGAIAGNVSVADGARVEYATSGTIAPKVGTVTLAGSGKIDLKDNKLITSSGVGSWDGNGYTGVTGMIAAGRNEGTWDGNGIISTMPEVLTDYTTVAVASAGDVLGIGPAETEVWAGQTVSGSDTLVTYTYGGDANLDGMLNIDDYGQIDFNVGLSGVVFGYFNGDFNYDGLINIDDYGIIDFNIGIQGPPFPMGGGAGAVALSGVSAVPEPMSLGVMALAATALFRRRRRRK